MEVPTRRPAVGAGELLDVRAGHVVIAERVDVHNTSFADESPVEGACDRLDFWRGRQKIVWYRRPASSRDSALPTAPVVADAVVAVDAASSGRLANRRPRCWGPAAFMSGVSNVVRRSFPRPAYNATCRSIDESARGSQNGRAEAEPRRSLVRLGRGGDGCECRRAQPHAAAENRGRAAWSAGRLPERGLCDA